MPRYVILEHDWPTKHWDFMLEVGDVLQTWRLPTPPAANEEMPAEKIFDHRLMYLDYEGPIRGDRGTVARWDAGLYQVIVEESRGPDEKSRARSKRDPIDRRVMQLEGNRLQGMLEMTSREGANWTLRLS
jgi:DNA polymerase Ligase (LigD)